MQNDPHYLRKIIDLSEKSHVVTHRPILAEHGIKLVDSGVRISESLYDKLVMHQLMPPIDECLSVDNSVTSETLVEAVKELLTSGSFANLLHIDERQEEILHVFGRLPINALLSFKLTVARDQMPRIFRHSLEVAVCAVLIAMHHREPKPYKFIDAAAAGLFHDIGLLHINQDLLQAEGSLSDQERHHIYSHPILAHLILERCPEWHPLVSSAVLEHHERQDASGYPRGLPGARISPLGQLLALAELTATLVSRQQHIPLPEYVHVILCLNQGKFNPAIANTLIGQVLRASVAPDGAEPPATPYSETLADLVNLSEGIQSWHSMVTQLGQLPIVELINLRIQRLERNLAGVGVDLENWGMIDSQLAEDDVSLRELKTAANEGAWQLRAIAQEIQRKWAQLCPVNPGIQERILNWLKRIDEH